MTVTDEDLGILLKPEFGQVFDGEDQMSDPFMLGADGDLNYTVQPLLFESDVPLTPFVGIVSLQKSRITINNDFPELIPPNETLLWTTVNERANRYHGHDVYGSRTVFRFGILPGNYTAGKVFVYINK